MDTDECSCGGLPMPGGDSRGHGCGQCAWCTYCKKQIKGNVFDRHHYDQHMEKYVLYKPASSINDLGETPLAESEREQLCHDHDEAVEALEEDIWTILGI